MARKFKATPVSDTLENGFTSDFGIHMATKHKVTIRRRRKFKGKAA
jgi:hypothetical protein